MKQTKLSKEEYQKFIDVRRMIESFIPIYQNTNGNVIIVNENGNERILDEDFNRTLIIDENDEEFVVTGNGRVMGADEFSETGGNRFKQEERNHEREFCTTQN